MRRYGLKADKAFGGYEDALFAQQVLLTVEQVQKKKRLFFGAVF